MKKILLVIALILLIIFPSCDGSLIEADGNTNEYIYPYLEFELSDTLTYYTATVVAGANLTEINIPGEFHTDFGAMPVKEFCGFENPMDASSLKEIHFASNIEYIDEDALIYAENLQRVEHESKKEHDKWTYLPKLSKTGHHFIGWQAGDEFVWEMTESGYVQNIVEVDPEHTVAKPIFVKLIKVDAVLSTCTDTGSIAHYHCNHCGKEFSDADGNNAIASTVVAALGHYLVENQYKAPTCQETGIEKHFVCERCNEKFEDAEGTTPVDDIVIQKVEHKAGENLNHNDECHYYKCVWCATELEMEKHNFDEGVVDNEACLKIYTCLTCGKQKTEDISDHEHILGDDKIHFDATCTEPEYNIGTCLICGREHKEILRDKLGHLFGEPVEYIQATCQTEGLKRHFHCEVCELNFENKSATTPVDVVIAKLEHNYKQILSHDDMRHWYECRTCDPAIGEVTKKDFAAHSYDRDAAKDQFLVSDATCTASAVYYKSCECGVSSSDTFEYGEPLGHEYEKEVGTLNYDYGKTDDDKEYHWLECIRCSEEKEGSRSNHVIDKENSTHRICGTCGYKTPKSYGGIDVDVIDKAPSGTLIEVSQVGNVYTFKLENGNEEYPITSYRWETSGIAISEVNGNTFSFEAPNKKAYTVRCVFSNEYGTMSLAATVYGGGV
ncbi:MAG: hypothetical protein J6R23_03295 [Spirochaetales bacterium]|nr:hypothetical protein [Spirochaetales bacterium]